MRKVRKIQAKRKACFTNKKGKKQCYILNVPRKYKVNPDDDFVRRELFDYIKSANKRVGGLLLLESDDVSTNELLKIADHLERILAILDRKG